MNFNDEEIAKTKGKMYAITTFAVIGTIIIFILISIFGIKSSFNNLSLKKYYVLDINNENKDMIIELFNQEKENIFYTHSYCETMYKIEYYNSFPDGTNYTMYCKDEDNIEFGIDKVGEDTLATYIRNQGYIEKR